MDPLKPLDTDLPLPLSTPRWGFGLVVTGVLVLSFLVVGRVAEPFWAQALMALLAIGFAVLLVRQWQARAIGLTLTEAGIVTDAGLVVVPMDAVLRVDRSPFAFKPSNGFVVVLDRRLPRLWQPGLYWRIGRRVGIGGVLNGGMTRLVADQIALRIAART